MNRILVVDDEQDVLEALYHSLGRRGYQVSTASCGNEAIEKVKKERFDVALLDIQLPDISGIEVLEQVKQVDSEIEAIILINGLKNDSRFINISSREDIKSAIVIPLIKDDTVLGILSANRITIEENFTKVDLYKANIFASLASLALDNANLYKKLKAALDELNQAHEQLKNSQQQLVHTSKLAALGRLVSDMAHEANNPLMIIQGNAQLCLLPEMPEQDRADSMKGIVDECKRAKGIIERLLKFSRPSKGTLKEVDINSSIDSVVAILEHQFTLKGVEIKRNYGTDMPRIWIDEQQMQEVFMNFLNNARDAMAGGGEITVTTARENNLVRVDFKDTGCGMSADVLKRLCEPFFTTKEKGNGLGLSVCYGIINAHRGELKFESELDKGTTATIILPVRQE